MKRIARSCILGAWLFVSVPASAGIGDPDVEASTPGSDPMSIYSTPGGSGRPFAEAFRFGGGGIGDASISIRMKTEAGDPIAYFPAEDIWLAGADGGLAACGFTASPDHNTDLEGRTVWTLPLRAGGRIDPDAGDALLIVVNGGAEEVPLEHLRFNSSDIDGDGRVNLTDVGFFTFDLGGIAYRSDFNWDGIVNVSDAGMMAAALGDRCP